MKLDYPILSDPKKKVAKAFGVVGSERKVPQRWTYYIGPDRKILHIDKKVRPGFHGKDVVAKLKELKVPKIAPAGKIKPEQPSGEPRTLDTTQSPQDSPN